MIGSDSDLSFLGRSSSKHDLSEMVHSALFINESNSSGYSVKYSKILFWTKKELYKSKSNDSDWIRSCS